VDVRGDARARAKLRDAAERTKIALSSALEYTVQAEFVAVDANNAPVHLASRVTRREFEAMIEPLLSSTIELTRRALDDARLVDQRLTRICLVGGSTRIPLVRAMLAGALDAEIHDEIDPDLAVALGASLQAGMLEGAPVERILVDVAAHSLGIRVLGAHEYDDYDGDDEPDTFAPVLRRNVVLPGQKREEFYTIVDDQAKLKVDVFQGEGKRCSDNRLVGTFDVALEPRPAHSPIEVMFAYDLDGVVRVTVAQPGTDNSKTVQLRLADASQLDTPLLRKARSLLAELEGDDKSTLSSLLLAYEAATPAARESAEEALLDFFVELDNDGEDSEVDEGGEG
jgi:molecular chaperone DnaK